MSKYGAGNVVVAWLCACMYEFETPEAMREEALKHKWPIRDLLFRQSVRWGAKHLRMNLTHWSSVAKHVGYSVARNELAKEMGHGN